MIGYDYSMLTNAPMLAAMVVFAGGPHTETRTDLACALLERCQPKHVYLTGVEYRNTSSNLVSRIRSLTAALPHPPSVTTDSCSSTLESCRLISSELHHAYPDGGTITIVTSDYHAARARWLFSSFLPKSFQITVCESKDIPPKYRWSTPQNRQLIRGECFSWLYCWPLGLSFRCGLTAVIPLATILILTILYTSKRT